MMNRDFFSKAKTNLRNTILVSLFLTFIVLVFAIFAIIHNNSLPVSLQLLFLLIIVPVTLLFIISLRITSHAKKERNQISEMDQETESASSKITELISEDNAEFTIDLKKLIPDKKLKIEVFADDLLKNIAPELHIVQAIFYSRDPVSEVYKCVGKFAYYAENEPGAFKSGETLPGQAVKNKKIVTITNIPENYMTVASGLGKGTPGYLTFVPLISHEDVAGLIEFATFVPLSESSLNALILFSEKVAETIIKFNKK